MSKTTRNSGYKGSDALDWEEAMSLLSHLENDGRWRDAMLVAAGCHLGLRISDILRLRWCDLTQARPITVTERKTGKRRILKVNASLTEITRRCMEGLGIDDADTLIFTSQMSGQKKPMTRQRAAQILKDSTARYGIATRRRISTHTLRKTFGRRVWLQECDRGHGDQALLLLCDVFGHSSVNITKRYLGIRQEEILSVYDSLE